MVSSEKNIRKAADALERGAFAVALPAEYMSAVERMREEGVRTLNALADGLARSNPTNHRALREAAAAVFQQIIKDINTLLAGPSFATPMSNAQAKTGLRKKRELPALVRKRITKIRGLVAMYKRRCKNLKPAQLRYYAQDINNNALSAGMPLPYRAITSKWREEAKEIFMNLARQLEDVQKAMKREGFDIYKTEKNAENAMYQEATDAFALMLNEIDKVLAQP